MRAGVLPNHHNLLYTRRNDMRFDIADFRAVQNKAGAGFIANVGVETTPVFAAAPAANKRIDLLYLSQEITPGDPLNEIKFFIEPGTASPSPVAPSLPAARADAIPWMTVEIPAGATSMQSAGVIVKEIFPYTAMAGGTVIVRDLIELGAWAPADGSRAFCIAENAEYVRSGSAWRASGGMRQIGLLTNTTYVLTTAWADVPGLSFTVPGMAGQKLLLRASGGIVNANSGGDKTGGVRFVGGATPGTATNVIGRNDANLRFPHVAGSSVEYPVSHTEMTPAITGDYTVKLQARANLDSSLIAKLVFDVAQVT